MGIEKLDKMEKKIEEKNKFLKSSSRILEEEMNRVEAETRAKKNEELGIKNGFVDISEEDYEKKSVNK